MNRSQIIRLTGVCFAFICFASVGCEVCAADATQALDGDSVELAIQYKTGCPGNFVEVSVLMANPVPIASFKIQISLGGWNLIDFHTDSVGVEWVAVPLDTCEGPETCLVDTCYWEPDSICMDTIYFPVRYCYLDTVGSLISDFKTISCHGDVGDTSLPDCKVITVLGIAEFGEYIPASPSYRLLFKFGVDLFCMCDADTGRSVYFLVSTGFSGFGDTLGLPVPFKYYMGELFSWAWSVPGDANNDSAANVADASFIINYLFIGGPAPCVPEAADANADTGLNVADASWIINYLYLGGPAPLPGTYCPWPQGAGRINEDIELKNYQHSKDLNLEPLLERR